MNSGALLIRRETATGQPTDEAPGAPVLVCRVETAASRDIAIRAAGFTSARLLVTVRGVAVGQVVVPLTHGYAAAGTVRRTIHAELGREIDSAPRPLAPVATPITVVVPTRGRAESLRRCLRSVLLTRHPQLTVLVVDNDPTDDHSAQVVRDLDDARVSYVREPRRGTSAGRNRGLAEAAARGARFVAFVDDDVEVDPAWAGNVAAALSRPGVACVCGPVLAAELSTPAQIVADEALGWRKGFARRRFSLAEPPPESAIFPFSPGLFGVGANLAVDVAAAVRLGGFDPALGPGTPARGGEDCEFMIRLVLAGHTLAFEPSAYLWHHHRPTMAELEDQMRGYARGLGGFLTTVLLDRAARAAALRRLPAAVRQLQRVTAPSTPTADAPVISGPQKVLGLSAGAVGYLAARRRATR